MATFLDLTSQFGAQTVFTGSVYPSADNNQAAVTAPLLPNSSINTGSWPGLGNTWGASSLLTASLAVTSSMAPGIWWGIDYSWGTYLIPTESVDRSDPTSNEYPIVDQGISPGDWDPFPIPTAPPAPTLPPRDLTRYKKSYSFSRHQPVRIRLVRGG